MRRPLLSGDAAPLFVIAANSQSAGNMPDTAPVEVYSLDPGAGQLATDGYALVNLRGEVDLSDFGIGADGTEAFVEVRNLTDEEARIATSLLKDLAPLPGQSIRLGLRLAF